MALDQSFFVTRARQLFSAVFAQLSVGLPAHQAQAKIMELVAQLQTTYASRALIDQAADVWLDLHAAGVGAQRQGSESDYSLRQRIRQLPDSISPNALRRAIAAVAPAGVKLEILDAPRLWFYPQPNADGTALEDHFIESDYVGDGGTATLGAGIVVHVGGQLDTELTALGLGAAQYSDLVFNGSRTLGPTPVLLSSYLAVIAALSAAKAGGVPLRLLLDPSFV